MLWLIFGLGSLGRFARDSRVVMAVMFALAATTVFLAVGGGIDLQRNHTIRPVVFGVALLSG